MAVSPKVVLTVVKKAGWQSSKQYFLFQSQSTVGGRVHGHPGKSDINSQHPLVLMVTVF